MAALMGEWRRALHALDTIVQSHAHLVFSRRRVVGLLVMVALATEPRCLGLGLCALIAAELTTRAFGVQNAYAPYAYNALLCGIAIAREYAVTPTAVGFAFVLGGGSVLITAGVSALAIRARSFAVLSIPYVLCWWFALGTAPHVPLVGTPSALDEWAAELPSLVARVLQSFGAFLLVPHAITGAVVLLALLVHSRIATVLALCSVVPVVLFVQLAEAPLTESVIQTAACCAGLSAISVGGLWLVPSRMSSMLALCTSLLATFFTLGFWSPFSRLGLPLSFVPFHVALILVLSALRQRAPNRGPALAPVATDSPEELFSNYDAQPPDADSPLHHYLPFAGPWVCTQSVDGPFTHRGILRHGYDFEMYGGANQALCGGTGTRADDFHCYAQPILATANGTVAAVENSVPNNAMGENNAQKPWGNYVVVYHASGVYSLVAHLLAGSVVVYPGQFVARGAVLGYCGNSGRAPRPHLHFQLQTTAVPGSATIPSRFSDVVIRNGKQALYRATHSPQMGEMVDTLVPDHALGALFELPLGATLEYEMDGKPERIISELDDWGRTVLRSLDRGTQLVVMRSESRFRCGELRGPTKSVLTLLRLAMPEVPLERRSQLRFRSRVAGHWVGGRLRRLWRELVVPLGGAQRIELEYGLEADAAGVALVGNSIARGSGGTPVMQTRALLGGDVGPRLLEVSMRGRMHRAELNAPAEVAERASAIRNDARHALVQVPAAAAVRRTMVWIGGIWSSKGMKGTVSAADAPRTKALP